MNTVCFGIEICHTSVWIQQCGAAAWITPSTDSMPIDKKWPQCEIIQKQSQKQNSEKIHLVRYHVPLVDRQCCEQDSCTTMVFQCTGLLRWFPMTTAPQGSGGFITRSKQHDCSMQDCYSLAFDLPFRSFILFGLLFLADQKWCNKALKV